MPQKPSDPMQRPVSPELEMLMPVLAETMKFATQAVRQSSALADLLVEKGVVTREELNEEMRKNQSLTKKLMDVLDENIRKMA
jgi:transcription initiation factor IIE alpha subunit